MVFVVSAEETISASSISPSSEAVSCDNKSSCASFSDATSAISLNSAVKSAFKTSACGSDAFPVTSQYNADRFAGLSKSIAVSPRSCIALLSLSSDISRSSVTFSTICEDISSVIFFTSLSVGLFFDAVLMLISLVLFLFKV